MAATAPPHAPTAVAPLRWRRSATRLTPGQLADLRAGFAGMMALEDDRGYSHFAGLHGLPLPIECWHGSPLFLPWHRAFLYFFERALRDRVPNATLAWWNWSIPGTGPGSIPAAFDADTQPDGSANPLKRARVSERALAEAERVGEPRPPALTVRHPGQGGRRLPRREEVLALLELRDFASFTAGLEELHGQVHVWTGGRDGHMSMVPFAGFDPIFWAHHTMVDRLWRLWQIRHNAAGPPRSQLDQALPPFAMTVRQTIDVTELGYDYASNTASHPR